MSKSFFKFVFLLVIILIIFVFFSVAFGEPLGEGTCGLGLGWSVSEDGVLRIYPKNGLSGTLPDASVNNYSRPWMLYNDSIVSVVIDPGVHAHSNGLKGMFAGMSNCVSMDLSGLDVAGAVSVQEMFSGCSSLVSLDLSHFDTSRVSNMSAMFYNCSSLVSLNLDNWSFKRMTSGLNSYTGNFIYGTTSLRELSCRNWSDLPTYCSYAFGTTWGGGNSPLDYIDVTGWDVSNAKYFYSLFLNTKAKEIRGLDTWNTSNVEYMDSMFVACSNLETIDLSHFDTSNVKSFYSMFSGCSSLKSLDLSNFDTHNISNMTSMFSGCTSLESLNLDNWSFKSMTSGFNNYMGGFIYDTVSLKELSCRNWSDLPVNCVTAFGTSWGGSNSPLDYIDVTGWNLSNSKSLYQLFYNVRAKEIRGLDTWNTSNIESMGLMFGVCDNLESIDVSHFDTSKVTTLNQMFYACSFLTDLDVSNFDTSKVTDMKNFVTACSNLKRLDLSNWDFSSILGSSDLSDFLSGDSVIKELICCNWKNMPEVWIDLFGRTMGGIGEACEYVDVTGWDLSGIKNIKGLFGGFNVKEIRGLNTWDTSKIENMCQLFCGCSRLKTLDVSNFDVSEVKDMSAMFSGCSSLVYLDFSGWNTNNAENMSGMFGEDSALKMVTVGPNFDFKAYMESGSSAWAFLPNPPEEDDYNGSWIRLDDLMLEREPVALSHDYDSSYAGTWIWSRDDVRYGSYLYTLTDSLNTEGVISSADVVNVDFTNTRVVVPVVVNLQAYKSADFVFDSGDFEFELLDSNKSVIQSISNGPVFEDGDFKDLASVLFNSITFDEPGTYVYYIREVVGSDSGIKYDTSIVKAVVSVVDDHGYLRGNVVYSVES